MTLLHSHYTVFLMLATLCIRSQSLALIRPLYCSSSLFTRSITSVSAISRKAFLSHTSAATTAVMTSSLLSGTTTNADTEATSQSLSSTNKWIPGNEQHAREAREDLGIWPLDEANAALLTETHPRDFFVSTKAAPTEKDASTHYDLLVIGSGAGGLVSARQAGRRGAKSCLISAHLAGGDCLVAGCVPSKALLSASKTISLVRKASEYGVNLSDITVDFSKIMARMRKLRSSIAPVDGHDTSVKANTHVYQGFGSFLGPNKVQVTSSSKNSQGESETVTLTFDKAVIATGGRPFVPDNIPGLKEAPYTTNEQLFNLETLPPRMVLLGAGPVSLEMAQSFANFGSQVVVLQLDDRLFESRQGDPDAARIIQAELEKVGVKFVSGTIKQVDVLKQPSEDKKELPLINVSVQTNSGDKQKYECECLLVATGRLPNVEKLGLDNAGIKYAVGKGVQINDYAQCEGNDKVYAIGDCAAGVPKLTHVSGEMAKLAVQNALFDDSWKVSSLVVPAVMYTEPEYATVGVYSKEMAEKQGIEADVYTNSLEHNDRAILEGNNVGFCKIVTAKGTDQILGATIVAERAGEIINEVTLAMKYNIGLRAVGRNIHAYPTTGECVMMCGVQYINANWQRFDV